MRHLFLGEEIHFPVSVVQTFPAFV
jgi:hypothetical protein